MILHSIPVYIYDSNKSFFHKNHNVYQCLSVYIYFKFYRYHDNIVIMNSFGLHICVVKI